MLLVLLHYVVFLHSLMTSGTKDAFCLAIAPKEEAVT